MNDTSHMSTKHTLKIQQGDRVYFGLASLEQGEEATKYQLQRCFHSNHVQFLPIENYPANIFAFTNRWVQ